MIDICDIIVYINEVINFSLINFKFLTIGIIIKRGDAYEQLQ